MFTIKSKWVKINLLIVFFLICFKSLAQNDTIYFDQNWKETNKKLAVFYRIPSEKIKTKKAIGYKIKQVDSLYIIKDYYYKTNKLQFSGFSKDKNANYLAGKAIWYDENGEPDINVFNNKEPHFKDFKFPEWAILNLSYSNSDKSQFTGGLEFCDCKSNSTKVFFGIGYGFINYNGNTYGLPDLHLSVNSNLLFVKAGTSSRNAYTLAGVTAFNGLDLGIGYSFPYSQTNQPVVKGFTFSVALRLTANKNAYQHLNIIM